MRIYPPTSYHPIRFGITIEQLRAKVLAQYKTADFDEVVRGLELKQNAPERDYVLEVIQEKLLDFPRRYRDFEGEKKKGRGYQLEKLWEILQKIFKGDDTAIPEPLFQAYTRAWEEMENIQV